MKNKYCLMLIFMFLSIGVQATPYADNQPLQFADPLTDNMVVQQNKPFKVWGTAPPGQNVEITTDWLKKSCYDNG